MAITHNPPHSHALALRAKLFSGLADPSRLALLLALRDAPCSVGELVRATGLSQPNTSNHLGCLRRCGLVTARREGRHVRYRLADARVAQLLETADLLLTRAAGGVLDCARYSPLGER